MTDPWEAERPISTDEASRLIADQFPEFAGQACTPFAHGWDNTLFLVGDAVVFRFPRRALAEPLIAREAAALPILARRLPLPIPAPRWIGQPAGAYPWPFLGYRLLAGRPAAQIHVDEDRRAASAEALGAFLGALHGSPPDGLELIGDELRRVDAPYRAPRVLARLEELQERGVLDELGPWVRVIEDAPTDRGAPGRAPASVPCHGDLTDSRHVLVDPGRGCQPCGVIDWGDVHRGDPACDLGLAHGYLPRRAHGAFRVAYGRAIDEATWALARFRAVVTSTWTTLQAHKTDDATLLRASLGSLRRIVGR